MKKILILFSFLVAQNLLVGQKEATDYPNIQFTIESSIECTDVKSQGKTGTCWSFATTSFLESELIRMKKPAYNLSEMYAVRATYMDKAQNYLLRQGKANFSQGSLSHDIINAYKMVGAVPESAYSGLMEGREKHNHGRLERDLKGYLKNLVTKKELPSDWREKVNDILDEHLGTLPTSFAVGDKKYTAETFTQSLDINPNDYINFTSFSHHPFYQEFVLEIPDNYSNGNYYNVTLDEMEAIADNALKNGYSVAWDGDVSETHFSAQEGIAVVPMDTSVMGRKLFDKTPVDEMKIDQAFRQQEFENLHTTDDHLMHLVGVSKDQTGKKYYYTKNSWGEIGKLKGYLNLSESYFRLKTVAIMVHKDAIPANIKLKMGL